MSWLEITLDNIYYDLDHQFKVHLSTFEHDVHNQNNASMNRRSNYVTSNSTAQLYQILYKYLNKLVDKYIIDISKRINNASENEFIDTDSIKDDAANVHLNELYNYEQQLLCEMNIAMEQFEMECGSCNLHGIDTMMLSEKELKHEIVSMEQELLLHLPSQISQYEKDYLLNNNYAMSQLNVNI